MFRTATRVLAAIAIVGLISVDFASAAKQPEITDPEAAAADPDFAVQGEYVGKGALPGGKQGKVAAQVIAGGKGTFTVVLLEGGLPGDGWERGDKKMTAEAKTEGKATIISGEGISGKIVDGAMTVVGKNGKEIAELERIERKSPTLCAKPPEGAVVLFDGTSVDAFENGRMTDQNTLWSGITSKQKFTNYTLHLEFRLSWMPTARGQARSNSGVYLHHSYECQVLDSFGLEGRSNECGGIYGLTVPAVNMCLPPMTWQTYDVEFTAPIWDGDKKVKNARANIRHNGVVIHEDVELPRMTTAGKKEAPGPCPLHLQSHGNKVQYRNIWVKEKK